MNGPEKNRFRFLWIVTTVDISWYKNNVLVLERTFFKKFEDGVASKPGSEDYSSRGELGSPSTSGPVGLDGCHGCWILAGCHGCWTLARSGSLWLETRWSAGWRLDDQLAGDSMISSMVRYDQLGGDGLFIRLNSSGRTEAHSAKENRTSVWNYIIYLYLWLSRV